MKNTYPLSDEEVAAVKTPPADRSCLSHPERVTSSEFLGQGEFLGLKVVKHLYRTSNAVTEVWEAPALDCNLVYIKTSFLDGAGKVTDATVREVIEVKPEEPAAWIFSPVEGLEVTPSEALKAEFAADPNIHHELETENPKFSRQDANYRKRWDEYRAGH